MTVDAVPGTHAGVLRGCGVLFMRLPLPGYAHCPPGSFQTALQAPPSLPDPSSLFLPGAEQEPAGLP